MKIGILIFAMGLFLTLWLTKIRFRKTLLKKIGTVFGILLIIYGVIMIVQPDDYIKYTKTTITKDRNSTNTK